MPRPHGWTEGDEKLRDECVTSLLAEGVPAGRTAEERARDPKQRAHAICTAMVAKHKRDGNPPDVIAAAKDLWKRLFV